LLPFPRRRL